MDFPVAFKLLVETDFARDGDGSKHCVIDFGLEADGLKIKN